MSPAMGHQATLTLSSLSHSRLLSSQLDEQSVCDASLAALRTASAHSCSHDDGCMHWCRGVPDGCGGGVRWAPPSTQHCDHHPSSCHDNARPHGLLPLNALRQRSPLTTTVGCLDVFVNHAAVATERSVIALVSSTVSLHHPIHTTTHSSTPSSHWCHQSTPTDPLSTSALSSP